MKKTQLSLHSQTCNLLFQVITLSNTSLTPLSYSTASVLHPIPLSAANHFSSFKALCMKPLLPITNGFLNVCGQFKFKVEKYRTAHNCSLYCTNNVQLQPIFDYCLYMYTYIHYVKNLRHM